MAIDPMREEALAGIARGLYGGFDADQAPVGEFAARRYQGLLDQYKTAPMINFKGNIKQEARNIMPLPGEKYRLISGGKIIGEADTPEAVQALANQANEIGAQGSRKATVILQKQNPGGEWGNYFENLPDQSALGLIADIALPVAGSFLVPGLGLLGGIGGAAAGAGAGSALSSVAQGRNLQDTLLRAGLSAGTAAAIGGLGKLAGGTPAAQTVGGGTTGTGSLGFSLNAPATTLPTFTAPSLSGLGGVVGGSIPIDPSEIVVSAVRGGAAPALASGLGGGAGSGIANIFSAQEVLGNMPSSEAEEMTVTGQRPGDVGIYGGGLPVPVDISGIPINTYAPPQTIQDVAAEIPDAPEMVVTAMPTGATGSLGAVLPGLALTLPAMGAGAAIAGGSGGAAGGGMKLSDYLMAGAGGLSVLQGLGGLLGIGGSGSGGGASGIGGLNPNGGTVSYQPLNRTQNAPTFDPFTYGQTGGEFKFFNDAQPVYQTGIGTAPPAMIAPPSTNPPRQLARGGPVRRDYGKRADGSQKGIGFLGELKRPDGGVSTELSIGVNIDGKEVEIPTLVPTLSPEEVQFMLKFKGSPRDIPDSIVRKAIEYARPRLQSGQSPFYQEGEPHARGGRIRGIGGGQDDLIDAKLSDGEYVFSAQDVADLGDGSNEHGARKLDEMRRLIRKNAGRKNIKTIARPQKSVSSLLRAVK